MSVLKQVIFGTAFLFSVLVANAQTYVFAELQGQPTMSTTGWTIAGNSYVGDTPGDADTDNNELILTNPTTSQTGRAFFNQPINIAQCTKWRAEFEFRIWEGTSADGIAFCFLDAIPTGVITGGELGLPANANGLKVAFDTYNNSGTGNTGCGANPEVQIAYGPGYVECPIASTPPTYSITRVNSQNWVRSANYQAAVIDYNAGNITVTVNGTQILTAFHVINFTGYVGFSAGTGANHDRQSIRNVTIYADLPPSNAGADVSYCTGSSVQLGASPNAGNNYSWSPAIGLSATNVANPTMNLTNTGTTPVTLTYTVTTTLSGGVAGCSTQDQVVVTINPKPTSTFTLSKNNPCVDEPITVTYSGNMGPLSGYNWNFNGGNVASGTGQGPYQVSWPNDGAKQVSLWVSQSGCFSDTTVRNLTVHPNPTLSISGVAGICAGDTAVYTGTTDVVGSVIGWTPGPLTGSPVNLTPTTTTTYTAQAVSANGCLSNDTTFTVTVKPTPIAGIIGDTLICSGDSTQLSGTTSETGSTFVWLAPVNSANQQVWVNPTVNQEYQLVVVKDACVSDTAFFTIQVDSLPNISAPDSIVFCQGETKTITVSSTTQGVQYDWQPGGTTGTDLVITPTNDIQYDVIAYNQNCTSEVKTINVVVYENCDCKLMVPNVFTPNGDQVNDEFTVLNVQNCNISSFDFVIYNRWGAVVWKSSDINIPWDGKCLISNCADGTYFWAFTYSYVPGGSSTPKSVTEKGTLTVAR